MPTGSPSEEPDLHAFPGMPDLSAAVISPQYHSVDDEQSLLTIDLDLGELEKLSADAFAGLNSLPRRGLEIGGILLGHREPPQMENGPGKPRLVVDGFFEVESEHLFGPSYRLSDKDRLVWRETLLKLSSGEERKSIPVGVFRSTTAGEFDLDGQDAELLSSLEDVLVNDLGERVFLLLKPVKSGANQGRAAIWQDGAARVFPPFPLNLRRMPARAVETPHPEKPAFEIKTVPSLDADEAERHTPGQEASSEPFASPKFVKASILAGPCRMWMSLTAATCVILVASGSYVVSRPAKNGSVEGKAAAALSGDKPAGNKPIAALSADPEASATPSAGPSTSNPSPFEPQALSPSSPSSAPDPASPDSIESGAVYRNPADARNLKRRRARDEDDDDDEADSPRREPLVQTPQNPISHEAPQTQAANLRQPEQQSTEPIQMTVPLRGDDGTPGGNSSAVQAFAAKSAFRTERSQLTPEFTMQVDSPFRTRALGGVLSMLSPMHWIKKVRGDGGAGAPKPTFAAQPEIPQKLRSQLHGGERVDVRVAINKNGKVMRAVASSPGQQKQRWLTASVLAAAYQWEFRPAKISKEPVESAALIHFVFHNPSSPEE